MELKEEIAKLIRLQEIDSEIFKLREIKDKEKPRLLEEIKNRFEEKRVMVKEKEEEIKNIQLRKKEKEMDLASKEEGVRKAQGQLYQLKTNQEYHAKLKEISFLKADISVIEEDILNILEDLERADRELAERNSFLKREEEVYLKEKQKIEEEIKEIEAKINNLEAKRKRLTEAVDKKILERYEYLLKNRNGLAIVPLKDGVCGGCFMDLPPEVINRIKQYKDIIFCEMCARMLYLEEDFGL